MSRCRVRGPLGPCARIWGCLLWVGCGHVGPGQAPVAGPQAPASDAQAATRVRSKFVELSQQLEKLGSDDRVDRDRLQAQLLEMTTLDPSFVPARFDLAVLQAQAGEVAAAQASFRALATADPNFTPALENAAAAQVRAGQVEEAMATYRRIIAHEPKNLTSRLALARLNLPLKKYQESIELCRYVLQRQADAIEAFRILAQAYTALDNVPMAQLIIGRAFKVVKDDVEMHHLLAHILLDQDDLVGGLAKLKEVVRMAPERLLARAELAEIAMSYRDFGNAAQQYEAILKERPGQIPVQVNLAVAYKGLGRYDQAEALYRDVLTHEPKQVAALWNLGVLYHRHLKRYDDAVARLNQFQAAAPKNDPRLAQVEPLVIEIGKLKSDVEAQRAQAERDAKRQAGLEAACAAVVAHKPVAAAAIGNEQERVETAWQLMVQAQQTIGAGDVPAGEAAVRCALAIIPDTAAANKSACAPMQVMWTQILYQLQRLEEARASIAAALICDPENPDAQLIQQQLKELMAQQAAPAAASEPAPVAPEVTAPKAANPTHGDGKKEKKR